ncbi:MAG: hypothetical protein VX265_03295, partial [Myxococcota bacterium]|nr:hypothetical protein [Myxococcota bacterium]
THDQQVAVRTASRLRNAGAVVLVLAEPGGRGEDAFCRFHPDRIAARTCLHCTAAICTSCRQQAGDEDICPDCVSLGRGRRRTVRLRQLFALFLFAVFCYQVFAYFRHQQQVVSPGGPVRVAILQFSSPKDPLPHAARALNAVAGQGTSFEDIGPWLSAEHRRYGGKGSYAVDVLGPWGRTVEPPPLSAPGAGPLRAAWRSFRYPRYFHGLATDQGVDPDSYGGRIYVIYTDEMGDRARESRGSEKGRVAIAFVSSQEQNPAYAVLTVAHELGHVLGADDLYDMDTFRAVHPEGFVEPYAESLYPQAFAELMAVDRPVGPRTESEVHSLDEVRIGHRTASSLGWIRKEQADLFYQPPALSAQDRLRPSTAEETGDGMGAGEVDETAVDAAASPSRPVSVPR